MAAIDGLGRVWVWGGRFGDEPSHVQLPSDGDGGGEDGGDGGGGGGGGGEEEGAYCVLAACGTGMVLALSEEGSAYTWGDGGCGRLGLDDGEADHETPQRLERLSTPELRVQRVACGKGGSEDLDEGPQVLVLATPEAPELFSEQFARFYRESEVE